MNTTLTERITRLLAFMLRHQPEQFDLEVDAYGFADLDDVVDALSDRVDEDLTGEDIETAIASGDRPRYEIQGDRIRALYGHSIAVEPGEPSKPPELLYVGLPAREAERAASYGLRGGRRRFLHLALTADDAMETGRRSAREYNVITIQALDAWEDGINFYDRKSLFLAEEIPTHLLQVGPVHTDGLDDDDDRSRGRGGRGRGEDRRERGGRGDEPRGRGGPRGRGRGHDRERYEDRDRDRDRDRGREPVHAGSDDRPREDRERRPRGGRGRPGGGDGRPDRGERGDRREARGGRDERPRRGDRDRGGDRGRPGGEDRAPREDRAPEKTITAARKPESRSASGGGGGFGSGIFEERPRSAPRAREESRREAPPKERARSEEEPRKPAPSPPPPPNTSRDSGDSGPAFGAGL